MCVIGSPEPPAESAVHAPEAAGSGDPARTAHRQSRSASCADQAKPGPELAGSKHPARSRSSSSHHRTQLLMGVRGRTVAMPGPQTARTMNPLGGKGASTIHGYQIMTAPRRHPLQCLAALGALQNLLKRPPIPHRRDRIQATAQSRVAGNLCQRPYRRRRFISTTECRCLVTSNCSSEACCSRNTARPDIRQSPVENFRPHTSSTTASNTSRTTRSKPGLLTSLRNFSAPILGYLVGLATLY